MKTPLLYGIGITFVTSVITLVSHLLGYWTDPEKIMKGLILGFLCGITVFITGTILGTRRVRAERGNAEFTYGQAFATGLLIAIFAAQMSNPKGRDGGRSRMGMSPRRFCIQELSRSKGVVQQAVLGLWAQTRLSLAPIR